VFATASNPRTGEIRDAIAESKSQRQIPNPKSKIPSSILPRDSTFRQAVFRALFQILQIWKRKPAKSGKNSRAGIRADVGVQALACAAGGQLYERVL
jgi:hypothetical protein